MPLPRIPMYFTRSLSLSVRVLITAVAVLMMSKDIPYAQGCAGVFPDNRTPLEIAAEDAVILYDDKTGTEHFIRQAVFNPLGKIKDFGFLVPTPTPPMLSTTESSFLPQFTEYTRPQTVYHTVLTLFGQESPNRAMTEAASSTSEIPSTWVTVREQQVGDMDTAVMQASDARTLRHWLTEHGYTTRPALEKWIASYVKRGWTITAFKIAENTIPNDVGKEAMLAPVRMSFQTPHPFYPYQEPADDKQDANIYRKLRVLYIGNQRVQGTLSDGMLGTASQSESKWETNPELSRPLTADQRSQIAKLAKLENNQSVGERLTLFDEHGNDRPADKDLYFSASADQSPFEYPDYLAIHETRYHDLAPWLIIILLLIINGIVAVFRRMRAARKRREERWDSFNPFYKRP